MRREGSRARGLARFAAVAALVVIGAAIAAGETPDGAFDDADDFAGHDVMAAAAGPDALGSEPIWLDGGHDDPFRSSTDTIAATLRSSGHDVRLRHWPGGHDSDYWNARMPAYLRFYASALARCGG